MMKYIVTFLALVLFLGCGNTTEETASVSTAVTVIEMVPDTNYTVYKGDRLEKSSVNTQVSITKNVQDDSTTVVLLEGSAQIITSR